MGGSPGRLNNWTLVSRTRYALVWGAIGALIVLGLPVLLGSISLQRALLLAIPALLISSLAQGWIWYPRAKRKLSARHG